MVDTANPQIQYFINGKKRLLTTDELAIIARYGYTARSTGFVDVTGKFISDFKIIESIINIKGKRSKDKTENTFDKILADGVKKGKISTKQSVEWFFNLARNYRSQSTNKLISTDNDRLTNKFEIGKMYLYRYDAKHKDTLPYWDASPLIFPIADAENGWLGINLHYIAPKLRLKLLSALYDTINNEKYDDSTKLQISYEILKNSSKYKAFKPCIKRYLKDHTQSQLFEIHPREWPIVAALPIADFQKKTANYVYARSDEIISK